jgi:hypothetical protein
MSFRCEDCQKVQPPGSRRYTVPVEWREHIYPYRRAANVFRINGELWMRDDRGGRGKQIVREVRVCGPCKSKREEGNVKIDGV